LTNKCFKLNNHHHYHCHLQVNEKVQALSTGQVIIIALYMDGMHSLNRSIHPWSLYTEENRKIITKLVNKKREKGKKGIECFVGYNTEPMYRCMMNKQKIPDDVRE
jgi:hypothetical protein